MSRDWRVAASAVAALVIAAAGAMAAGAPDTGTKPPDEPKDTIMGVYEGTFTAAAGAATKFEAHVIGEGDDTYRAVMLLKGLDGKAPRTELTGKAEGGKVALSGRAAGVEWKGQIADGALTAASRDGKVEAKLTARKPPTLGQKPPPGAVVLLPFEEGKPPSLDAWTSASWRPIDDGSMLVRGGGNKTRKSFGSCQLHLEVRTPYMPKARGQGRGNSGVYLMSRYEVQVLDSFGLTPKDDELGGIYHVAASPVYACLPPGTWQTYDITLHAPKFGPDGKKTRNAVVTILINGVKIFDNLVIPGPTPGNEGGGNEVAEAPIRLQDHGNPVRFRNIWLVPLKE